MEMNLEKTERGFCSGQAHIQKPPPFLHRHLILGEMKTSRDPIFHKFKRQKVKGQMGKRSDSKAQITHRSHQNSVGSLNESQ
jgi:hypothetical protein